ncbi:hypothetical protein Pla163_13240 [Planctomycetes bacterium Pla163]|uniref:Uncharacterized protein n=1 Tax=Rohdeia mirabilis TaxID=2528008 RepID=A0A518CYE5_9BACT|nr:hypothetical protein Pla163_13240 [Planctomycetes bacterium Pla163]
MIELFLALVAGRLGLGLLPAGEAGSRRLLDPVHALAPAAVLGIAVWRSGQIAGRAAFGVDDFGPWALLALAGLALVQRALGPAGLVPRHERHERPAPLGLRAASGVCWSALVAVAAAREDPYLAAVLVAAWLVELGCERVGVAATARRLVGLASLGAFVLWTWLDDGPRPLVFTPTLALSLGGWAFAAGWIRRADRRDLVLSCAAFATCGAPLAAVVALGVLAAATARPTLTVVPVAVALAAVVGEWACATEPVWTSHGALALVAGLVGLPLVLVARRRGTSKLRVSATSGAA